MPRRQEVPEELEHNRRQNRLQHAGHTLLRYRAPDVYRRAGGVLDEVRAHLRCA